MSDYRICPQCGTINGPGARTCKDCNAPLASTSAAPPPSRRTPKPPRDPIGPRLAPVVKVVVTVLVVALIVYLVYLGGRAFMRSLKGPPPFPTSSRETAQQFFSALSTEDYQSCYGLLTTERKTVTLIKKNTRQLYFDHFARIRNYLTERIGPDFLSAMQIPADGSQINFKGPDFTLSLTFKTSRYDDKTILFALEQVNEFPIDATSEIGIEQYNRNLSRAIESIGGASGHTATSDDPIELIQSRPEESSYQREKRLIQAFKDNRQLDTRHTLIEWIAKEFFGQYRTMTFLDEVARDQKQPPQLRQFAQHALDQMKRP